MNLITAKFFTKHTDRSRNLNELTSYCRNQTTNIKVVQNVTTTARMSALCALITLITCLDTWRKTIFTSCVARTLTTHCHFKSVPSWVLLLLFQYFYLESCSLNRFFFFKHATSISYFPFWSYLCLVYEFINQNNRKLSLNVCKECVECCGALYLSRTRMYRVRVVVFLFGTVC